MPDDRGGEVPELHRQKTIFCFIIKILSFEMRKKNACILGEIINCLSKKNKKNFEKKGKKWLTISERSGIIFNVAANNGNTTMTT